MEFPAVEKSVRHYITSAAVVPVFVRILSNGRVSFCSGFFAEIAEEPAGSGKKT
jgi:hypothetical protein